MGDDFIVARQKVEIWTKGVLEQSSRIRTSCLNIEKNNNKVILRFNINAFKNNYKISDLLKMNLSIYAIKVGTTTLEKLNINNELNLDEKITIGKDNPSYVEETENNLEQDDKTKELNVYDVLLAGVEKYDQ